MYLDVGGQREGNLKRGRANRGFTTRRKVMTLPEVLLGLAIIIASRAGW